MNTIKRKEKLNQLFENSKSIVETTEALNKWQVKYQEYDVAVLDVLHDKSASLSQIKDETDLSTFIISETIERINQ